MSSRASGSVTAERGKVVLILGLRCLLYSFVGEELAELVSKKAAAIWSTHTFCGRNITMRLLTCTDNGFRYFRDVFGNNFHYA
jgi:hypothetical protein